MAGRIATISGTMLTPGVSRNRRLYTPELIAKAAARMSERIADPAGLPIVMRTHHDAGDNSRMIVGRLTGVKVGEDGAARYTADLYDTAPGRDIAALVTSKQPALRSVSIHGYWLGPIKTVTHDGESVTTGDDLEIDAVDFTATPGVLGATVDTAAYVAPGDPAAESNTGGRTAISEAVAATVTAVTEEIPAADETYSAQQKRDALAKGQAMKNASGKPAYTIKTKADLRKAIKAVGRGGADHDAIRKHVIQRAEALGLSALIPANWNKDGSMKENSTRMLDVREYYPDGPSGGAGFCIDAYNGPLSLTMRACGIDPQDLRAITQAAMAAAVDALQAMDPDMDADIDVPGADDADGVTASINDDQMESAAQPVVAGDPVLPEHVRVLRETGALDRLTPDEPITAAMVNEALTQTTPAAPAGDATTHQEVPAVSEPTPAVETASTPSAPMIALTQEQFAALLDRVAPARESAPLAETPAESVAPETAETAPPVTAESFTKADLAEAMKAHIPAILAEYGLPQRKGYRTTETDTPAADKAPTREELWADRTQLLLGDHGVLTA